MNTYQSSTREAEAPNVKLKALAWGVILIVRTPQIILHLFGRSMPEGPLGLSCHALRYSLATWLLDAGAPTGAIADLLGHSSIAIAAVYAKVVDMNKYTPSEVLS